MAGGAHYTFAGFTEAVVLDVETTGLEPQLDRVVSVAAIKTDFSEMASTGQTEVTAFAARVNPGIPISPQASAVHGIFDVDLADEPFFSAIAQELRDFIGDLPIVGHNIQFDKKFLNAEFRRAKVKGLGRTKSFCTMRRSAEISGASGNGYKRISLDKAAQLAGLPGRKSSNHDAMEDAQLTMQIAAALYIIDNGLQPPRRTSVLRTFGVAALAVAAVILIYLAITQWL